MAEFPRPSDLDLLQLKIDDVNSSARFELVPSLARPDGGLYGGTAIAVSVLAMEAATGRGALWLTTQLVATARLGATVECSTVVLASGRDISQVQVTGRSEGRVLFVSIGSTATPRQGGFTGQFEGMPKVTTPEEADVFRFGFERPGDIRGFGEQVEFRPAQILEAPKTAPILALWTRLLGGHVVTPAGMAFMADMVPLAIVQAGDRIGRGISLDNSLRFGPIPEGLEWVLLDLRGQMANGAHGHGSVRVWSPDGALLAVGSQSSNIILAYTREEVEAMSQAGVEVPRRN